MAGAKWRVRNGRQPAGSRREAALADALATVALVEIEHDVPLSRLTTIGTGGPARALARPGSLDELAEALAWAAEHGLPVAPVGLGSNLLPADDGVDALVVKLAG